MRTDVYSMGVILYEILARRMPFEAESMTALAIQLATAEPLPLQLFRPELPRGLAKLVMRAMARNREDRFQSMDDLLGALEQEVPEVQPLKVSSHRPLPGTNGVADTVRVFGGWPTPGSAGTPASGVSAAKADEAQVTILFLDDSEVLRREVASALRARGYNVLTASNVQDAGAQLATADLIMIDYHMPETDGPTALRLLRAKVRSSEPVLFYLYTSDRNVAVTFRDLGFDGAFTAKGDSQSLVGQVEAAARMLRLRRFRQQRK
jgi:CheY-like chemotaxis protein